MALFEHHIVKVVNRGRLVIIQLERDNLSVGGD